MLKGLRDVIKGACREDDYTVAVCPSCRGLAVQPDFMRYREVITTDQLNEMQVTFMCLECGNGIIMPNAVLRPPQDPDNLGRAPAGCAEHRRSIAGPCSIQTRARRWGSDELRARLLQRRYRN
jgi:hypothetical protein